MLSKNKQINRVSDFLFKLLHKMESKISLGFITKHAQENSYV